MVFKKKKSNRKNGSLAARVLANSGAREAHHFAARYCLGIPARRGAPANTRNGVARRGEAKGGVGARVDLAAFVLPSKALLAVLRALEVFDPREHIEREAAAPATRATFCTTALAAIRPKATPFTVFIRRAVHSLSEFGERLGDPLGPVISTLANVFDAAVYRERRAAMQGRDVLLLTVRLHWHGVEELGRQRDCGCLAGTQDDGMIAILNISGTFGDAYVMSGPGRLSIHAPKYLLEGTFLVLRYYLA
ncbi:hypothetical protein M885DRAFT_622186 [Pelagophyceae sp. CCMP2097]|nr:hypothetical protein M885DRAFT_622186 [Pelagophyceae sp. CCMP2097]